MEIFNNDSSVTFESFGISNELCQTLESIQWKKPSKIQCEAIPIALEGKDIVAIAETGSGKTGAYALPILNKMPKGLRDHFALIMVPTRELALQVEEQFKLLGQNLKITTLLLVGGQEKMAQAIAMAKKPQIIIATPGRLIDLMNNFKGISLKNVQYFILDEADKILKMDMNNEIEDLGKIIPKKRHTYLFSATLTEKLRKYKKMLTKVHEMVQIDYTFKTVDTLKQYYVLAPVEYKEVYLVYILKKSEFNSFLVFCNKSSEAQRISLLLRNLGFTAIPIYGAMTQEKRFGAIQKFKSQQRSILVGTDVASRGIDIEHVDLVINYDVPTPVDYIHRVGRTARAGRTGHAITLTTQIDVIEYQNIEESIRKKNELYPLDEKEVMSFASRVVDAQKETLFDLISMNKKRREKKKHQLGDEGDEGTDDCKTDKHVAKKSKS